jgi:hypothetical protein
MLERTDAIMNERLEPIPFGLADPTIYIYIYIYTVGYARTHTHTHTHTHIHTYIFHQGP